MNRNSISIWICVSAIMFYPIIVSGYMPKQTHPLVNRSAVDYSALDDYIVKQLGFANGKNEPMSDKKVFEWIEEGGRDEDDNIRGLFHFHDPTKSWDGAGIHGIAYSALQWAQNKTQGSAPNCQQLTTAGLGIPCTSPPPGSNPAWSWPAARSYFYSALTSNDAVTRDRQFSTVFLAIGHVMHLLADAAVPEHARNDGHLMFPFGSRYEKWCEGFGIWSGSLESFIDDSFLLYPVDYSVITGLSAVDGYIPISNFWDAMPDAATPEMITSTTAIGLSEYTNYNFLSPGTVFKNYAHPVNPLTTNTQGLVGEIVKGEDGKYDNKLYFSGTTSDGRAIKHLASTGYLWSDLEKMSVQNMDSSKFVLDELCFSDYASILVPKAVDYNVALLDYFFRGTLSIALPNSGVYSTATSTSPGFTRISLVAKNTTTSGEEMNDGTIQLVVKYKVAHEDPLKSPSVEIDDDFTFKVVSEENNVRSIPKDRSVELIFDLSGGPIPFWITDVYLQLVYHGKLGNEDGAVAVGFKDISEPTPVDFYNNMDKICLNGSWYDAGSPTAVSLAPVGWDVYPHNVTAGYLKISPAGAESYASPSNYTFSEEALPPGQLYRAYILTDYDYPFVYSNYTPISAVTTTADTADHSNATITGHIAGNAVKNQVDYQVSDAEGCADIGESAPCDILYYPELYPFRGTYMWGPVGFIIDSAKYPTDTNCSWKLLD